MAETIVTVTLCVKGDPERAVEQATRELNKWFTRPPMYPAPARRVEVAPGIWATPPDDFAGDEPQGEGYPEGTLLHYTIQSKSRSREVREMPNDNSVYILLRVNEDDTGDLVDFCKSAEEGKNVECAIIVRRGSGYIGRAYVGEFYSTPQAVTRMFGG